MSFTALCQSFAIAPLRRGLWVLTIVPMLLGTVGVSGAIAQVTNQSDVTGANPDVIFPSLVDLPGLVEGIGNEGGELGQVARELANQLGEVYEACVVETEREETGLTDSGACARLLELLEQADEVLNTADQRWQDNLQQIGRWQRW